MLLIIHGAIAHDINRQHAVFEGREYLCEHEGLVHGAAHGDGVVPWDEGQVCEGCGADEGRGGGDVVVECYVALGGGVSGVLWKRVGDEPWRWS